ncbi:MAG: hypothetical protein GQ574_10320 [Crocinitomix sp.]|nr:hypothetical protein [Crocinitomix sp.]
MKIFFYIAIIPMLAFSCVSDSETDEVKPINQIVQYNSLEEELYGTHGNSILGMEGKYDILFERTLAVSNNKDSYSRFFQKVGDSLFLSLGNDWTFLKEDSLTQKEEDELWNLYNTNFHNFLFRTCKEFQDQADLSVMQKSLVKEFAFDSYKGMPDLQKISRILSEMSEEEFQSKGIKQCCLIYIVDISPPFYE